MKTIRNLLIAGTTLVTAGAFAQADVTNHGGGFGYYLGWDAGALQNLDVKHKGNYPIDFYTYNALRARISNSVSTAINGLTPTAPRAGYMLLSGEPAAFTNSNAPFTRLHLIDEEGAATPITYAQEIGYRLWQRNGITFTGNSDQAYFGQKFAGNDNTDMVMQWSDNPNGSPWGVDRFKFIFTSQFTGAHTGMGSEYGLEAMRLFPVDGNNVNMGLGDFYSGHYLDPHKCERPNRAVGCVDGQGAYPAVAHGPHCFHAHQILGG